MIRVMASKEVELYLNLFSILDTGKIPLVYPSVRFWAEDIIFLF